MTGTPLWPALMQLMPDEYRAEAKLLNRGEAEGQPEHVLHPLRRRLWLGLCERVGRGELLVKGIPAGAVRAEAIPLEFLEDEALVLHPRDGTIEVAGARFTGVRFVVATASAAEQPREKRAREISRTDYSAGDEVLVSQALEGLNKGDYRNAMDAARDLSRHAKGDGQPGSVVKRLAKGIRKAMASGSSKRAT